MRFPFAEQVARVAIPLAGSDLVGTRALDDLRHPSPLPCALRGRSRPCRAGSPPRSPRLRSALDAGLRAVARAPRAVAGWHARLRWRSRTGPILGTVYSMPFPFAEQVARVAIPLARLRTRLLPLQ